MHSMSWLKGIERVVGLSLAAILFVASSYGCNNSNNNNGGPTLTVKQTNLVSDQPDVAPVTDPNLVNPWGVALSSTSPFWVANNHSGTSTLYNGNGAPFPVTAPLVVTIPPPENAPLGAVAAPTGIVFNGSSGFVVSNGTTSAASVFIFATEDGTISGWNPNVMATEAVLAVDNSDGGAIYKGLAMATNGGEEFLYATNFHAGEIDVFDSDFQPAELTGSFTDASIPAGFAPFNIFESGGQLFVTYAKQDENKEDDVAGPGNGFVDIFMTNGTFVKRFASQGDLNSPWGMVIVPDGFGNLGGDLLIGNFGDGRINIFDPDNGQFIGQLSTGSQSISIEGLWSLVFGNGGNGGDPTTLYFTAGPDDESHGLFGMLESVSD